MATFDSHPNKPRPAVAKPFELETVYYIVRERIWLIILYTGVIFGLALLYYLRAPRIYTASALVQVEQGDPRITKFESIVQEDLKDQEMMRTIEQTLVTRPVLKRVLHCWIVWSQ
jgi:uncharacterized protein involved in exopolysaccharide biosynthesis